MAVEARHLNLFSTQLIQDREVMMNAYNSQFLGVPSAAALPENQFYYPSAAAKTSVNTDSGVTYNNIAAPARKRSRDADSFNQFQNFAAQKATLAGDEIMPGIQQYQYEIDAIISQHTKKIRYELESRQKLQARVLAAAIGEGVMKKLKEKDEQIQRMAKLNLVLQERVKSLYVENQLWRDLAQSNEATANSLRTDLEQVLHHVGNGGGEQHLSAVDVADEESCCGSRSVDAEEYDDGNSGERRCRLCGEREASVLLLPCRHLCLCSACGSGSQQLQSCPVCNFSMTATLHVNMS
ncbi:BOI-related E3 ubiquitin-protein ligase 1-like [Salvia splendens]|uniref:BOI-related E3 ubiquitin-protein ligase 1-like n=1 Tax=Salvia splendens TaxID=180675 RepID=UPI001C2646FE|nr:BOI-related E3 ubiquitin-protein ligase 1-like [Salvia splendens]